MTALRDVMSTDLVSVGPEATVAEAAELMSIKQVGSVLVMDGGSLLGIFTERDIVRALGVDFGAAGNGVLGWMTRDPVTAGPETPATEALDLMLEHGFRHLPVADGDRVLGVVSIRDLSPRP